MICPPIVAPYRLGSLCKRGHDHAGTGMTLRYAYGCRQCMIDNAAAWNDARARACACGRQRPRGHRRGRAQCDLCRDRSRREAKNRRAMERARRACDCGVLCEAHRQRCHACRLRVEAIRRARRRPSDKAREASRRAAKKRKVFAVPPELRPWRATLYEVNSQLQRSQKASKQR